jgi:hypothetical protein
VLAECRSVAKFVFPNPSAEIICHSNVESLGAVSQDVNAVASAAAGMHRSFASLRMTPFRLCSTKTRNSVRDVHQNCDDSLYGLATTLPSSMTFTISPILSS